MNTPSEPDDSNDPEIETPSPSPSKQDPVVLVGPAEEVNGDTSAKLQQIRNCYVEIRGLLDVVDRRVKWLVKGDVTSESQPAG